MKSATKYEMHVYTMGTRAYAEEVCAAIDPDGKIFGGRVLSRDESGSASPIWFYIPVLAAKALPKALPRKACNDSSPAIHQWWSS